MVATLVVGESIALSPNPSTATIATFATNPRELSSRSASGVADHDRCWLIEVH